MGQKSYLMNQIRLVSLNANDLFTDEEYEIFLKICELVHAIEKATDQEQQNLIRDRKRMSQLLKETIKRHAGTPRKVRLKSIMLSNKEDPAISWKTLKFSKKISEFESEMSRAMGLHHLDYTFDKIIIKWKNEDLLEQIVKDGFEMDVLTKDGSIVTKTYRYLTSSAGQLRTDKISCISVDMWEKIHDRIMCGLTEEHINEKGGCNVNKYLAYIALANSATDVWEDFDIDRVIVVGDWESEVTGVMDYIKPDYTIERGEKTVIINHIDGAGMMLPTVSKRNFMIRSAWIKGLLCSFDFIRFCVVNNTKPVIKDLWGVEHDLLEENIQIILTKSQFKMAKFYDSWDQYKAFFKKYRCKCGKTNYEEDYVPDKQMNYQFLNALVDMTDDEIKQFTEREHTRIENLAKDKNSMLQMLKASSISPNPFCRALLIYPELLRDEYARQQLKDTKKKMLLDAKSGAIKCENKRLFVVPDLYAACEFYFLGKEHPEGLLENGIVACRRLKNKEYVDLLRSPSLYMEHAVRKVSKDPKVYEWFRTDAIYTSCHDLISRILQFDVDGDQLNAVTEEVIVKVAMRNIEKLGIVPLFYDANKADPEIITRDSIYNGLLRAHKFSNIGEISNMLTRLWNRNSPDITAAALLTYLNNLRIDGAKTGSVNEYTNYPAVAKRINKATGGPTARMPYFFQFSKNGRASDKTKDQYAKPTASTMNRICAAFSDIGNINMNYAGIPPFNYKMLMSGSFSGEDWEMFQMFCDLDGMTTSMEIVLSETPTNKSNSSAMYELLAETISEALIEKYGSLEYCFPYITKALFSGEGLKKSVHKRMYWRVFGEMALENIQRNLRSYWVCNDCNAKIPSNVETHECPKNKQGFAVCVKCEKPFERINPKQCRCAECQKEYRLAYLNDKNKKRYGQKKVKKKRR